MTKIFEHPPQTSARFIPPRILTNPANDQRKILAREVRIINATLDWQITSSNLEITVYAPRGHAWEASKEKTLTKSTIIESAAEAVAELISEMADGLIDLVTIDGEDEEDYEDHEDEVTELNFG